MVQRFVVSAKRRDGSSLTRQDLDYSEARSMVTALRALDSWPLSITMEEMQAGIEYESGSSGRMALEDALKWEQPDDDVTRILRRVS